MSDLAFDAMGGAAGALIVFALTLLPWRSWWRRIAVARKRARIAARAPDISGALFQQEAASDARDLYWRGGAKRVIDERNEMEWERNTCPRVQIAPHDDNTGARCRNSDGRTLWVDLHEHDCCDICNDHADRLAGKRADIKAWLAERSARPPIATDREALSDEVAPQLDLRDSPLLRLVRGGR